MVLGLASTHSLSTAFILVCQPGPSSRKAANTSVSSRIATESLAGRLRSAIASRNCATVAAVPPPCVIMALRQLTPVGGAGGPGAAMAAATCSSVKKLEVLFGLRRFGIAARNYVRRLIAISPDQVDDAATPEGQALKSLFAIVVAIIFFGGHGRVKCAVKLRDVNLVLFEVDPSLRFIPSNHA